MWYISILHWTTRLVLYVFSIIRASPSLNVCKAIICLGQDTYAHKWTTILMTYPDSFAFDTSHWHLTGSPNAVAFSYFLIQHKATLGNLQITKIQVFHGNEGHPGLAMVFYVEAVPSENVGEGADNTNMLKDSRDSRTLERRLFRKYRLWCTFLFFTWCPWTVVMSIWSG